MCGIAGIFHTSPDGVVDGALVRRMGDSIAHRGPDGSGTHLEGAVGLAHRRLSIIDLSTGAQPLYNEDQSVVVVFNGEIYNYHELTEELARAGHVFRTHSDTEAIVHGWEEWGEKCVDRFRGMFAFALWDARQQKFFIARDRLGVKPVYYAFLPSGEFVFGSELKALLVHPNLKRDLDPFAIEEYFAFGYIPEPRSIFRTVRKLPAATTLTLTRDGKIQEPKSYWDVPFAPLPHISEEDAAAEFVERFQEAVKIRMISDVPLGAFLSGGVDSSAVVAMMAYQSRAPITTCSISFGEAEFDESRYAQMVSDRYHTDHFVERVASDDFDLIDRLVSVYDEPFADSSALPTYRLCELARKRVTVALSGDGGDENFAGYRSYQFHVAKDAFRSLIPDPLRVSVFSFLGNWYPRLEGAPSIFRAKTTFQTLAMSSLESFARSGSISTGEFRRSLFSDTLLGDLQGYRAFEVIREHAARAPTDHPLSLVQYIDMKLYLCADILTKVDRASMAHSLEVRGPLLDYKLIEWISGLPPSYKLRGGMGKYLFRRSMERYLPRDILYRKKMGFSIPVAQWLRGPLRDRMRESLLGSGLVTRPFFNRATLERVVTEHETGARDHSGILWALLIFESFCRHAEIG